MGHPQDYGVIHYLDDSLLDDYSFPVKKLYQKLFPTSFLEWLTLEGTKIIYVLQRKLQIKFGTRCPESVLSFQHSLNIKRLKKNHPETQTNAQNNKRLNRPIKTVATWHFFCPP
jgi:hypothetical protein